MFKCKKKFEFRNNTVKGHKKLLSWYCCGKRGIA